MGWGPMGTGELCSNKNVQMPQGGADKQDGLGALGAASVVACSQGTRQLNSLSLHSMCGSFSALRYSNPC